ncbi:uncharacterized protein BO80DRAFT_420659 [Aspergillus ibericus CBS 121593]|uniref:Transcription factor Rba50 n=1 Tax=Aspergillus ibericus CBS 121593 TaxID=1448316 RepID=A0A395HFT8_9EURO|nr:hypothetical protein BO80DRAFT_420659 [Aspergillus ibericus CBS 121593]RAL06359.1 hypothetical protein BO80DRAFT_420659 [Aspergillus ibericus CBS 121593]
MAFRGERFILDLDSDDDAAPEASHDVPPGSSSIAIPGMIGEIRERTPAAAPAPPAPKPSTTGFPAHRRRAKPSAFKQRRAPTASTPASAPGPTDEKTAIAQENERQLASMSDAQIQQERQELMESMDSSLLERFLRRARIDADDNAATSQPAASSSAVQPATAEPAKDDEEENAAPAPPAAAPSITPSSAKPPPSNEPSPDDVPPAETPSDLHAAAELPPSGSVHFPAPPSQTSPMPNLDPSSPSFLSDLQTHYFPNISHDPAALSWLQPPSADPEDPDSTSAYHPASNAEAIHPANLRFSLLGTVLSPSTSLSLPTTLGLHHHGKDPHAAGYTIPELAILSRSTFPAQRCIAWQVLGRILFRLGKGQFGERGSPLVEGLWSVVEREGVVAGMMAEADGVTAGTTSRRGEKGSAADETKESSQEQESAGTGAASSRRQHASATAWAVEGVWLWQMGGAGDRGVLKEGTIRSQ